MEVKLNAKEINDFKKEVITASLKQEIRKEIHLAFTNEIKKEIKENVKARLGNSYGFSSKTMLDSITKDTIVSLIKEDKEILKNIRKIADDCSTEEVSRRVEASVERILLQKTKTELDTITKSLMSKLYTVDRLNGEDI